MHFSQVIKLLSIYLFLSFSSICTKWASAGEFLSWQYIIGIGGTAAILGIYAVIWQQMLKNIPLATAYMFRGSGVIFTLLYSAFIFSEKITCHNLLGSVFIIAGITLFSMEKKS